MYPTHPENTGQECDSMEDIDNDNYAIRTGMVPEPTINSDNEYTNILTQRMQEVNDSITGGVATGNYSYAIGRNTEVRGEESYIPRSIINRQYTTHRPVEDFVSVRPEESRYVRHRQVEISEFTDICNRIHMNITRIVTGNDSSVTPDQFLVVCRNMGMIDNYRLSRSAESGGISLHLRKSDYDIRYDIDSY